MKKILSCSLLEFLTPWHASILNAKPSISKSNNGMKFIKAQYSFPINMKLVTKNKKFRQKEKNSKLFYDY